MAVKFDIEDGAAPGEAADTVEEPSPPTTARRSKMGSNRQGSVISSLVMNTSKSFYQKEHKKEHLGASREYWRDMILGINDGLVSTFLLAAGVVGANLSSNEVLLTTISGMIAGSISMAAGEYVATKTQEEVYNGEIELERKAIKEHKRDELRFLSDLLTKIGIPEANKRESDEFDVRRAMIGYYEQHDEAHLKINVALAFGATDESRRSPWKAGFVSFFLFFLGSLTSVIPFAATKDTTVGIIASLIATLVVIIIVGIVKSWATKSGWFLSALENFMITCGGGGIAYGVGYGFNELINK